MKKVEMVAMFVSLVCVMGVISCSGGKQKEDPDKIRRGWTLVWEEDFDGDVLDETVWSKIPRGKSDRNRYMSDHDALYVLQDGKLVLRGVQNTFQPGDTASYLTGGISTKDKKTFGFGRIEIRARLKPVDGAWPGIWMLPEDDVEWPMGGEINILERFGQDDYVYHSVHSHYTQNLGLKDNPPSNVLVGVNPNNYNIYGVEKYQDSLVFFVNDTRTKKYPRVLTQEEGQFPFSEHDFYLLLNVRLGGRGVGAVDSSQLPADMFIDWVRFYEPATAEK